MTTQNPFAIGLDTMRQLGASQAQITGTEGERQRQGMVTRQAGLQDEQLARQAQQFDQAQLEAEQKQLFDTLSKVRQLPVDQRMTALQNSPFIDSEDFAQVMTPELLSDAGLDQVLAANPYAKAGASDIGQYNPRDYTTESFSKFLKTGDPSGLERFAPGKTVTVGGIQYDYDPVSRSYKEVAITGAPTGDTVDGVEVTEPTTTTLSAAEQIAQETEAAASKAAAESKAKATEKRNELIINEGRAQAKSIPTLKQTISLLDAVETGGWTNQLKQSVKQRFGVESADEGVLTANLGKAVLSQLRQTFGAAFTEREGARLENIEAGFGKSAATNKALLTQLLQIAEKDVKNAIKRSTDSGDDQTAAELQELLDFQFELGTPEAQPEPVAQQASQYTEGQTATNPTTGEKLTFRNGQWVTL